VSHEVRSVDPSAPRASDPGSGAASSSSGVLEPFEVFRQEKEGEAMKHGGSVMAPDAELAVHYARELYGRRQESLRLWIVRRADIAELDDPDLLQPPLDRSFKKPGGYVMRDKLAKARERSGAEKPRARAASHDTTGRRTAADGPRNAADAEAGEG
jgi:ring-1,2-phenylacetyl-CoA epoxidase subunit PaaB